jgi:hypothetical protein
VRARFPTHEPYRAWSNFEFIADDGSINEVDLLAFTSEGFFLIEIKSRPGRPLRRRRDLVLGYRRQILHDRQPAHQREYQGEEAQDSARAPHHSCLGGRDASNNHTFIRASEFCIAALVSALDRSIPTPASLHKNVTEAWPNSKGPTCFVGRFALQRRFHVWYGDIDGFASGTVKSHQDTRGVSEVFWLRSG